MEDGSITIGVEIDTNDLERQIKFLTSYLEDLYDDYERISKEKPFEGQVEQMRKLSSEIVTTKKKLEQLNTQKDKLSQANFSTIQSSIQNIGNSMGTVISKVTKWGLALFGVRSMYNFIRQSASILAGQNQQLQADIDYIRYAIASTLQPVIERIVQLIYKLLSLINSIAYSFFGVNLFANATSKAIGNATTSAKQLKKQLAGFDEMNILQDQSAGGGGAGGGAITPSVDLSKAIDLEQAEKIKNFFKGIIDFWEKDWADFFKDTGGKWGMFVEGLGLTFKGFYDVFKGIVEIVIGVWDLLVALFKGDYDSLGKAWEKLWNGCKDIFKGVIEIIVGILEMALGIIKGIFISIVEFVRDNFVKIIVSYINSLVISWHNAFTSVYNFLVSVFNKILNFINGIISRIIDTLSGIGGRAGEVVGNAFKTVVNAILSTIETTLNTPIRAINKLINTINDVPGIDMKTLSTIKLPRLAKGGVINMPGRGVAIGGEQGAEGVIPLTDSQQMELLGEAIGRHINLSATIPVYAYNRQVAREIRKIELENAFAGNR